MKSLPLLAIFVLLGPTAVSSVASARGPTAPTPRAVEHNNRGAKLMTEGQLERAETELKTAIELSPDYAEAYNNLGILYKQRDLLERALEYFQKAVAINPRYASAHNHIAAVHITRGEYDLAVKAAATALKKEPTFADAVYNKGLALFLKGRAATNPSARRTLYALAEKEFSKATQLDPKLAIAHKNMGDLYTELGRYELAAIRYRLAVEDDPQSAETWRQLANVYRLMGDAAKGAEAEAKAKAAGTQKTAADHYAAGVKALTAGEERFAAGNTKGASALFNQAIQHLAQALLHNPKSADAAYFLGLAYHRQGADDTAAQAWNQTLTLQPDHAGALYNLGTLEAKQGRAAEATAHLCRFLTVGSRQFPAEAATVRQHIREQGLRCQK